MKRRPLANALAMTAISAVMTAATLQAAEPVTVDGFIALDRPSPAIELPYGTYPSQRIDIFMPVAKGPHPVAILVHGGCWTIRTAGREQLRHLGADLAERGVAVWSVGYRRADEPGGGYPGTYLDVALAIDRVRSDAGKLDLDLRKVALVGHSAGGHLALWAAARHGLPTASPLRAADPFIPSTVLSLAGIGDLKAFAPQVPTICGPGVLEPLTTHSENGQREPVFDEVSPAMLPAPDAKIIMISGILDRLVPPYIAHDYTAALARKANISIDRVDIPDAGHFDLVTTGTTAWNIVRGHILDALGISHTD
jgi:acetyl esterase/lipase